MAYSDKVVDHYNNPRNVGSMPKKNPNVGTAWWRAGVGEVRTADEKDQSGTPR